MRDESVADAIQDAVDAARAEAWSFDRIRAEVEHAIGVALDEECAP